MKSPEATLFLAAAAAPAGGPGPGRAACGLPGCPVLIGAPLDRTTTYRSGTAEGPRAVREASRSLESYSLALDRDLEDAGLYDAGDIEFRPGAPLEEDLAGIEQAVAELAGRGLVPVVIGGEHLVTLPVYRALAARGGGAEWPVVLHYDAHADLRREYEGAHLSHATVLRRVAELAGGRRLWQFGLRSGEREEMAWGRANVNRPAGTLLEATREALTAAAGHRLYLTVDIDVLDPAQAPGTGNPEPGGPAADELFEVVRVIGQAARAGAAGGGIDLVGADLVEVSPGLDPSGRTQVVAAKILRELIISGFAPGAGPGGASPREEAEADDGQQEEEQD